MADAGAWLPPRPEPPAPLRTQLADPPRPELPDPPRTQLADPPSTGVPAYEPEAGRFRQVLGHFCTGVVAPIREELARFVPGVVLEELGYLDGHELFGGR